MFLLTIVNNYDTMTLIWAFLHKRHKKGESIMSKIDLSKYGINNVKEIVYNPSYEFLYEEEMKENLTGYDKGQLTELNAVNVMTGVYTGRSPKDKYIVVDENSKNTVWWTTEGYKNDNHPMSEEVWAQVKELAKKQLSGKRLFVVDAFCGANKDTHWVVVVFIAFGSPPNGILAVFINNNIFIFWRTTSINTSHNINSV